MASYQNAQLNVRSPLNISAENMSFVDQLKGTSDKRLMSLWDSVRGKQIDGHIQAVYVTGMERWQRQSLLLLVLTTQETGSKKKIRHFYLEIKIWSRKFLVPCTFAQFSWKNRENRETIVTARNRVVIEPAFTISVTAYARFVDENGNHTNHS